jgi:hypothetical protein
MSRWLFSFDLPEAAQAQLFTVLKQVFALSQILEAVGIIASP